MGLIGAFLRFDVQEWCFVRCAMAFIVIVPNPPWPPGRDGRGRHATAKAIVPAEASRNGEHDHERARRNRTA